MESVVRICIDSTGPVTVAMLDSPGGRAELRFDGAREMPSGVFRAANGALLTGRDAFDAATAEPDRYVPVPLRLLSGAPGDSSAEPDPAQLVAAALQRVRDQAVGVAGGPIDTAVLVVPPGWGPQRRTRLRNAAHQAGLPEIEMVDAATAFVQHHVRTDPAAVLVCRVLGSVCDIAVVRRAGTELEQLAALSASDLPELDGQAAAARVVDLACQAVQAADLAGTQVTMTLCQAPTAWQAVIAAGLRAADIAAPVRAAADADVLNSALALTAPTPPDARRRHQTHHVIAVTVPPAGAALLLWLLLQTGVSDVRAGDPLTRYARPAFMYTLWPAWAFVAILAFLGATAATLLLADRRLQRITQDGELDRRRYLARGLQVAAAVTVAAGLVTTMLGTVTYDSVPTWYLLLWTTAPAILLAGIAMLLTVFIQQGYTAAIRWQAWLRLPNSSVVLVVVGLVVIHLYVYTAFTNEATGYLAALPDGVDRLGTIALALAVLPLLFLRFKHQVIASPFVIGTVMWTQTYANMAVVIGILATAINGWWLVRIRPAGAFSDPDHPANRLAAELEFSAADRVHAVADQPRAANGPDVRGPTRV